MDICRMFADICMYRKKNVTVASTGRRADICIRNESRVQSYREHSSLVNGSGGSISPIIENDSGTSRSLILSYMESSGLDN